MHWKLPGSGLLNTCFGANPMYLAMSAYALKLLLGLS